MLMLVALAVAIARLFVDDDARRLGALRYWRRFERRKARAELRYFGT